MKPTTIPMTLEQIADWIAHANYDRCEEALPSLKAAIKEREELRTALQTSARLHRVTAKVLEASQAEHEWLGEDVPPKSLEEVGVDEKGQ